MSKNFKDFINEAEETAPVTAPAEAETSVDSPEIALDPRLEKEVFIDSFEVGESNVVIKSLGLGPTKPVVVYIDDKRWEVFPGPRIAKREARRHIKKGNISINKESLDVEFESLLSEALLTKSEVFKWINRNKRKFDNSAEAAFAVADEFGMEDELENEKHWLWSMLKKVYKESYEVPFLNMLNTGIVSIQDGTKIKIDPSQQENIKIIYNHLDESNKNKFREAFIINKENHNKVMKFVKEQIKGN
jgi:hypothetical protein